MSTGDIAQRLAAGGNVTPAEQFFYENAGWSYDPATETEEQGRRRGAVALARAEERMKAGPYFVDVEPDPEPYDGDVPYDGPLKVVNLWQMADPTRPEFLWQMTDPTRPELLGCIGGIACEEGDPYLRVVAAELALEYLPKELTDAEVDAVLGMTTDEVHDLLGVNQVGYICKSCGGPSPLGVGYVDNSAGAAARSAGRTGCDCGQSRSAVDDSDDNMPEVPDDFPVRPLDADDDTATDPVTCGTCGRRWDDAVSTSYTPAPSARCPFEAFHS